MTLKLKTLWASSQSDIHTSELCWTFFTVFVVFQLGSIYIWSYVYNIVRIYSPKISNEAKVDDSALETDPENNSTCSMGALVLAKDGSQTDHEKQFEIESAMPNGGSKVALH